MSTTLQYPFHSFTLTFFINIITFLRKLTHLLGKNKLVSFKIKPRDTLQTCEKGRTGHTNILLFSKLLFDIKDTPPVLPPNE